MQHWDLLEPWCEALEIAYPGYLNFEDENNCWNLRNCRLRIMIPTRYKDEESFQNELRKIREGLALMSAASFVDNRVMRYLFEKRYGKSFGKPGEERYEKKIPARFLVGFQSELGRSSRISYQSTLITLFGALHQTHPSAEYLRMLEKISAMSNDFQLNKQGLDIAIPVCVDLGSVNNANGERGIEEVAAAAKVIRDQWTSNKLERPAPGSRSLRCTFMVEPMITDIDTYSAKAVWRLIQSNVLFSQVSFNLGDDSLLVKKELEQRRIVGWRITSMFCNKFCHRPELITTAPSFPKYQEKFPLQIGSIDVRFTKALRKYELEALFSALVCTQATEKMSFNFSNLGVDDDIKKKLWGWIAYGLFTERARQWSSVTNVALYEINGMSYVYADILKSVVKSKHPDDKLYGLPNEMERGRDVTLKANAPIRVICSMSGEINSEAMILPSPIKFVRILGDDGKSTGVSVLVPGYGRCCVRRKDLNLSSNEQGVKRYRGNVTSLTLGFSNKVTDSHISFLKVIGQPLLSLTISGLALELDPGDIFNDCPNLLDLTLCGRSVDMYLDFREFRKRYSWPPIILVKWQSIPKLCKELSNSLYHFGKCVRRLRIHFGRIKRNRPDDFNETDWKPLQVMLTRNQVLERLDVILPYDCPECDFSKYHLNPLKKPVQVPIQNKIAFLSVLIGYGIRMNKDTQEHKRLKEKSHVDQFVTDNIFSFAKECVVRKVYCHVRSEASKRRRNSNPMAI